MSLFRVIKYSSILYFLGKYKAKLFRVAAVLLFALVTSLLYQDVAAYLQLAHPDTVIYALLAKIVIVYGSLVFVLWQFKPEKETPESKPPESQTGMPADIESEPDRLSQLQDVSAKARLNSRYQQVLEDQKKP